MNLNKPFLIGKFLQNRYLMLKLWEIIPSRELTQIGIIIGIAVRNNRLNRPIVHWPGRGELLKWFRVRRRMNDDMLRWGVVRFIINIVPAAILDWFRGGS